MDFLFFDSSALAKRYQNETGSHWVRGISQTSTQNVIYIVSIALVEVSAALMVKQRTGELSLHLVTLTISEFRYHFEHEYNVVETGIEVMNRAAENVFRYPLRA